MAYTALYRKFRPQNFDQVRGQEHIVKTLKNQINADRLGHAYLFCGTRGTGKTSVAKLFAKSVNCERPINGSPCNECSFCMGIASGSSMNVIEIDAASNNGVENIRQIRDEVQYSPAEGRYKVYIIDEVHMLSIGAFNALLKTLEEPPSYVIFILATTEVHKIPITILSRCQRYDFKRITAGIICERLEELMVHEDIDVEEKALKYIAKTADGSLRDALSLLDQCIAYYMGQLLTYENVLEVLGAVDTSIFSRMLRHVIEEDPIACIRLLDNVIMTGRDLSQFVIDFTWYMRNLLLVKTSDHAEDIIDASKESMLGFKEESKMIDSDTLMRYIRIFSELSNQIKYASSKRVFIEIALIKLTKPAMEKDLSSILNRLNIIEKRFEDGVHLSQPSVQQENTIQGKTETGENITKKKLDISVPEDVQYIVDNWSKIEHKLEGNLKIYYRYAKLSVNGSDKLVLVFRESDGVAYDMLNKPEHISRLEELIGQETGKAIKVDLKQLENNQNYDDGFVMVQKKINMKIEEEDF